MATTHHVLEGCLALEDGRMGEERRFSVWVGNCMYVLTFETFFAQDDPGIIRLCTL